MDEEWFVARVFELAGEQGLLIQERRPGRSICFNETSKKWLHEGHIRQLYREGVLADGLERADLNRMIEGGGARKTLHPRQNAKARLLG
ncbi:hypothetical protein [Pseudomonas aeruginosa]|uniref:hypothetical protein n=1 Tax=Pseudomonas aeruginosa TaxID=287 RepID=UPI00387F0F98